MKGIKHLLVLAAASSFLVAAPRAVHADEASSVTINGEGRVSVRPDVVRLFAGVEVHRKQAGEAYSAAREAASKLTAALQKAGVAKDDIRTTELSVGPEYAPNGYPTIAGYRAGQGVEAVLRDVDAADKVIDAAVASGQDIRLNSIAFDVEDKGKAIVAARRRAFEDAKQKAGQYAKLAGRALGKVLTVVEENVTPPSPKVFALDGAAAPGASISPGTQQVFVTVRVAYELK